MKICLYIFILFFTVLSEITEKDISDLINKEIFNVRKRVEALEWKQYDIEGIKNKVIAIEVGLTNVTKEVKDITDEVKAIKKTTENMTNKVNQFIMSNQDKFITFIYWLVGSVLVSWIAGIIIQWKSFMSIHDRIQKTEEKILKITLRKE